MLHKRWGIGPGLLLHLPKLVFADFIFLHGPRTLTTILVGIIARLFRKRYVFISHACLDHGRLKRTYRKHPLTFTLAEPLFCFSVNGAEWIIVTGRAEEENIDRAFKKIRVARVENFFDIDLPFTEPSDIGNGQRYIFVGRIESDKGILSFVRVWKVTAGPNDRLCIAGPPFTVLVE
jgi:glycosyltransferase involved in cell wall biosynthesis